MSRSTQGDVARNARIHDAIIKKYERRHGEIFNPVEQRRLKLKLKKARESIASGSSTFAALDVGSGSGNLTKHLLDLGFEVTASDVSPGALEFVKSRYPIHETSVLNGEDLAQWPKNSFDLVATYSVLHHVPDYLRLVKDMVRVVKPGGVIFLDHEHSARYWTNDPFYEEFKTLMRQYKPRDWKKWFEPKRYYHRLRRVINPRYQAEGDIHVFQDDHIDWPAIEQVLQKAGCEFIEAKDYLVYQSGYPKDMYTRYAKKCSDMRLVIARKKAPKS